MMVERKLFTTLCNHVATFLYEVTASSTEVRQATAKRECYCHSNCHDGPLAVPSGAVQCFVVMVDDWL